MSTTQDGPSRLSTAMLTIAGVIVLVLAGALLGSTSLLPGELLFGWFAFIRQVITQVRIRWDGVAVWFVAVCIAVVSFHYLMSWWLAERARIAESADKLQESSVESVRWRLRASVAMVMIIQLVFVVGIATSGIVHQTIWIWHSPVGLTVDEFQTQADAELSRYDPRQVYFGPSWLTQILPYVPYRLDAEIDIYQSFNVPAVAESYRSLYPPAICPSQGNPIFSSDGYGLSQVVANPHALGRKISATNATVILLGEVCAGFDPWGAPLNSRDPALGIRTNWSGSNAAQVGFGSRHGPGANMCRIDGSVQFLSDQTDTSVLRQLNGNSLSPVASE